MKRLPLLLTNDQPSPLVRAGVMLLVPVVLVIALPLLLLLVILLYLAAFFHGTRVLVIKVSGKQEPAANDLQEPHFLEAEARILPYHAQPTPIEGPSDLT